MVRERGGISVQPQEAAREAVADALEPVAHDAVIASAALRRVDGRIAQPLRGQHERVLGAEGKADGPAKREVVHGAACARLDDSAPTQVLKALVAHVAARRWAAQVQVLNRHQSVTRAPALDLGVDSDGGTSRLPGGEHPLPNDPPLHALRRAHDRGARLEGGLLEGDVPKPGHAPVYDHA